MITATETAGRLPKGLFTRILLDQDPGDEVPDTPVGDGERRGPLLPGHPAYASSTPPARPAVLAESSSATRPCWPLTDWAAAESCRPGPGARGIASTSLNFDVSVFEIFSAASGGRGRSSALQLALAERPDPGGPDCSARCPRPRTGCSPRTPCGSPPTPSSSWGGAARPDRAPGARRPRQPGPQHLRAHRGHRLRHRVHLRPGRPRPRPADRPARSAAPVPTSWTSGCGRCPSARPASCSFAGDRRRPRLPAPPWPLPRAASARPVRPARQPHVPHRRPGPLDGRRRPRLPRPRGRPGQGAGFRIELGEVEAALARHLGRGGGSGPRTRTGRPLAA